jgi:hypothetical protein
MATEGSGQAVSDGRTGEANNSARVDPNSTSADIPSISQKNEQGFGIESGVGSTAYIIPGVKSEFNPLYIFSYSKYVGIESQRYSPEKHRDIQTIERSILTRNPIFEDHKTTIENPSASRIVEWSRGQENGGSGNPQVLGPVPYQLNDFLWCKWYGKIPNNRLMTLRRYPIPVEDNLRILQEKEPLIPLAQAVTWWGEETGNSLSEILSPTFGLNWKSLTTNEIANVDGNALTAESLLDGIPGIRDNPVFRQALLAVLFSNPENPQAFTGYDAKLNEYTKTAWGNDGPYWNRIRGPVNVIDSDILVRNSGFTFQNDIVLTFDYKLRSYQNLNPKIAMLDLISNFLALTYNKADFWGGASHYFERTGAILAGIDTKQFEAGNFAQGIVDFLTQLANGPLAEGTGNLQNLVKSLVSAGTGLVTGSGISAEATAELATNPIISATISSRLKELIQVPLKLRSILDGRAIGEWHLTIGNPMNPIAVIGNLCLKSTTLKFSDALGLDDFPTSVTFKVTLQPGRPRAKQDIASMFNLGGGDMYTSPLAPPASAFNSYGERNSITLNTFQNGTPAETTQSATNQQQAADSTNAGLDNIADTFRPAVRLAYGEKFATSTILPEYFNNIVTKD